METKGIVCSGLISSSQLIKVHQQKPLKGFHQAAVMEDRRRGKSGPLVCHLDRKEAFRIIGWGGEQSKPPGLILALAWKWTLLVK